MNDVTIREASRDDLSQVLSVQRDAFGRVAAQLGIDPSGLPPLLESLQDLRQLLDTGMRFFVAEDSGRVIGSVRGRQSDATVDIGRLVVDGAYLRRGVATRLMDALEAGFPSATTFLLFTGADAVEPLALYVGRGYRVVRIDASGPVELVWLEKHIGD